MVLKMPLFTGNESKRAIDKIKADFEKALQSVESPLIISDISQKFKATEHEKNVLLNCIDRSLTLLTDMFLYQKDMPADRVTAVTSSIEKLLVQRKQFIQDYWSKPFIQFAQKEETHD